MRPRWSVVGVMVGMMVGVMVVMLGMCGMRSGGWMLWSCRRRVADACAGQSGVGADRVLVLAGPGLAGGGAGAGAGAGTGAGGDHVRGCGDAEGEEDATPKSSRSFPIPIQRRCHHRSPFPSLLNAVVNAGRPSFHARFVVPLPTTKTLHTGSLPSPVSKH
eukprot:366350-Chlamydomonas_euryale.AAC.8